MAQTATPPLVAWPAQRGGSAPDALVLSQVTKQFGTFTAVDGFSLRVPAGEVLGFLGPNGAGKTTTLRMVMGILHPDRGELRVLGAARAAQVKDRIGYLPEERGLYRKMTVEQTLRYFGRLKGLGGTELRRLVAEGLERVGLSAWSRRKVETLSKGMSQKLQFLATILHRPELVILDEPFSGLDPLNADLLERMLADLRRGGATVIFSTHQMEQAERLCDRIVLINRGRKLIDGTLSEVRARFAERMVTVEGEGEFDALRSLPGVHDARITAGHARLEIGADADPDVILRAALPRIRIRRFEVQRPSLQEIFVKLVAADSAESAGDDRTVGSARDIDGSTVIARAGAPETKAGDSAPVAGPGGAQPAPAQAGGADRAHRGAETRP